MVAASDSSDPMHTFYLSIGHTGAVEQGSYCTCTARAIVVFQKWHSIVEVKSNDSHVEPPLLIYN